MHIFFEIQKFLEFFYKFKILWNFFSFYFIANLSSVIYQQKYIILIIKSFKEDFHSKNNIFQTQIYLGTSGTFLFIISKFFGILYFNFIANLEIMNISERNSIFLIKLFSKYFSSQNNYISNSNVFVYK